MRKNLFLCALTGLVACTASMPIRWAIPSDFELITADNQAQQQFDLKLMSKATGPLCLSKEAWPAERALPAGFDGATLITSSGKKGLLSTGSAYCPGGCGEIRIEPGQSIQGALPYSAFGDAAAIANEADRKLEFEVHPYACSK